VLQRVLHDNPAACLRACRVQSVRLQLPSQTSSLGCCIDATQRGNLARFINHRWGAAELVVWRA
jgi:hypothetical protein